MTTNWKPTVHQAYTTPNLLNPTLQQTIPNLIKNEIHRLANLTLFQNNFQSNSKISQVPVDMRFTDNSLNIRVSKSAPWISLVPSNSPMTPEEQAVDAIRRDVMEKIASLWGRISNSSSDESDLGHTLGSSNRGRNSRSMRTRSRRSRRDQQKKDMRDSRQSPITISKNKIDSSTHTTNNYYCCHSGAGHLLPNISKAETQTPRKDMYTQTDPSTDLSRNFKEIHSSEDSRDDGDSSSDESKESSTSFSDSKSRMGNKTSTSTNLNNSDTSDVESESPYDPSSSDESEHSFTSSSDSSSHREFNTSLQADSLQLEIEMPTVKNHQESTVSQPEEKSLFIETEDRVITETLQPVDSNSTDPLESFVSARKLGKLKEFLEDSIKETEALIELTNSSTSKIDDEMIELLHNNKGILLEAQKLLISDPQLIRSTAEVNRLLSRLDLDTLRLTHNNNDLEVPTINEDFDHESTLVRSAQEQLPTREVDASVQTDTYQTDEEIALLEKLQELSTKFEQLDESISQAIQKTPITSATAQTDDYKTDKEIKLQKKLQVLSKKHENLAGTLLKQSRLGEKQQIHIRELQFDLDRTKNELKDALRRFERLAESTETKFKVTEDQSDYIRELERKLAESQELLSNIVIPKATSRQPTPKKENLSQVEIQDEDSKESSPTIIATAVPEETVNDPLPNQSIKIQSVVESDDEQEDISEFLDNYDKISQDLQKVQEDDLEMLEAFHNKYADSGIHIELKVLADYLRNNQNPLYPERDVVLKRRQDVLDMLRLADRRLSGKDSGYSSSETSDDGSAVLLKPSLFIANREENVSTPSEKKVTINTSTQYERSGVADASTQDEKAETTHISTQVEKTPLSNASTQTGRTTTDTSTQVNNQTEREFELQIARDDISRKFEKLAESAEREFKSTEEQFEYITKLEAQVQALEDANENLVVAITAFKKRKILPKVQEDLLDLQPIEDEERNSQPVTPEKETSVELPHATFDELSPRIKKMFTLYREVNTDLTEIQYASSAQRFYKKYRESNVIADLTNFANSLDNIESVTDITLPNKKEIHNLIEQVQRLFLQEKENEDAEFDELQKDFDQRLSIYNELTSDLVKVQNDKLTLAEFHNKYAYSKALNELEIFARQERDIAPSQASVQDKIRALRELLIQFDNNQSTDL